MKRTDWKIFIATITYTLLFYKQQAGLNFFIFSIIMVLLAGIQNLDNSKKPTWLAIAAGTLFSGFFVFYYGTSLPIIANIISLLLLAGFSFKASSSLFVSGINAITSLVLAIPFIIIDFFKNRRQPAEERSKQSNWFKKVILLLFPLFVVFVFFVLYRDSNPLFLKITEDINLDWLSFPLVKHILVGLFFMYSFFVHSTIKRLNAFDENKRDGIDFVDEEKHNTSFFSKFLSLESETYTAMALFIMLNILIAVLNAIDINYLWLKNDLPQGLVFSDYLHTGTFTLILSILLAIVVVVFFFRGIFNFNQKGKTIKILGFLWVLQNIVMIVSAMLRNMLYIEQYGLTHKRIGVFVFLLLSIIGLLMTFIKIAKRKNIWFLFRKNAWAFYAVLVFSTAVHWDLIITKYNIKNANKNHIVDLDKKYLARLSHTNTYILSAIENENTDSAALENSYYYQNTDVYDNPLQTKIIKLLDYEKRSNWQEYCVFKNKNLEKLNEQNKAESLKGVVFLNQYTAEVPVYKTLSNIQALSFKNGECKGLQSLKNYSTLKMLNLSNNYIQSIDSLPKLEQLTHLNLGYNEISDFENLKNVPLLKKLNITENLGDLEQDKFPALADLEEIDISANNYTDWSFLAKQNKLETIVYRNGNLNQKISIKPMDNLKAIDLFRTMINGKWVHFYDSLSVCKNIEHINASQTGTESAGYFLSKNGRILFPKLKTLNLSSNNLQNQAQSLKAYKSLQSLDISGNYIKNINFLSHLNNLEYLNLSNNAVYSLKALKKMNKLKELDASRIKVKQIEALIHLSKLEKLNISANEIKNIDSIIRLQNLVYLDLSANPIEDITVLPKLKNLTQLNISNIRIDDYSFLYEMQQLKYLSLGNVSLETVEILKEKLPKTEIDYFSRNLNKNINYNNNKRMSYSESF